jgi:endonuclease IV
MLFGAHVSTSAGGIDKTIDRIEDIGGNAVQVFSQSPAYVARHEPHA